MLTMTGLLLLLFSSIMPKVMLPYNKNEISEPRGWTWGVFPAQGPMDTMVWALPDPGKVDKKGLLPTVDTNTQVSEGDHSCS